MEDTNSISDARSIADSFTIVARRASRFYTGGAVTSALGSEVITAESGEKESTARDADGEAKKRIPCRVRSWVRTRLWRRASS